MPATAPVFLNPDWLQRLGRSIATDPEFDHIGRWCDVAVELSSPEGHTVMALRSGRLADDADGLPAVRVHAPASRWAAFFHATPPAWHNDLLGLSRRHEDVELDSGGDTLVRHLRALNRLWEVARELDRA